MCLQPWIGMLLMLLGAAASVAEPRYAIGVEDDWYPYSAYRDGQIQGLSVDIVRAAFAASGTPVALLPYPYTRCMELARSGILAGCFNSTPNARVLADYQLATQPLFSDDILLWARRDAPRAPRPLLDLEQLYGARIAVTSGYEYGHRFDNDPHLRRVPVRRDINGFRMLQRGRVDYCAAFRGTARALFEEHPELAGQFLPVMTLHHAQLYLSFSRRHPQAAILRARFDAGLRQLHERGDYQRLLENWQHSQPGSRYRPSHHLR